LEWMTELGDEEVRWADNRASNSLLCQLVYKMDVQVCLLREHGNKG